MTVDGHRLKLTSLDKVIYPETETTKAEVIHYYAEIAPFLLPHSTDRPATRKRWVNGVGTADRPGQMFFQKNLDNSAPSWVERRGIEHKDHTNTYPLVNDAATLTWLAQISALEIHVPQWRFGPRGKILNPDRLVLDLDPGDGAGLPECVEVAMYARSILQDMGLQPLPVTSGSKGIHLYAPLDGRQSSDEVSAVAKELARALQADHPDLVVSDMKRTLRTGKVLVDWSQNNAAKTTVCPYSLRGRLRPMVAAPRTWEEFEDPKLEHLDYREVLERVRAGIDPATALISQGSPASGGEESPDRLSTYRSMRDAAKTPEPVPAATPVPGDGNSFVIQEHHARRLHYDFRLEHDGVLVSWAVPKGLPTDVKKNHLGVQTEDHPLEYGSFEGTIPKGEYGAGEVTIWDAGTYELEKWRDGEEVIVTLHGREDGGVQRTFGGPRRFALIHTGEKSVDGGSAGANKENRNWLVHLMKDQSAPRARPGEPRTVPFPRIRPMLATAGSTADLTDDDEWVFEMKWDGVRAIVEISPDGLRLVSRNGNDMTALYPELAGAADVVHGETAVLDGEIVALNRAGRPDFGLLQTRMKLSRRADIEKASAKTPVDLMLFDLLYLDGNSLLELGYGQRRQILAEAVDSGEGRIHVPPVIGSSAQDAVASSRELGLEGVMAKKADGLYSPGNRSRSWIKLKNQFTQEVIVVGWRPGSGRRANRVGSLLVAVPEDGTLRYVGRVGTGFSEKELTDLTAALQRMQRRTSPVPNLPAADARDAHWVTPKLVGEVEFSEQTAAGRLRHPAWRGWRPDKDPADVVPEVAGLI